MADRELRIKATTEGTDKAAQDIDKLATAEGKVDSAQQDATKSSEELKVESEALVQTLNSISPALGGMVDGLLKAFQLSGQLGKANVNLTDIITAARTAVLKYKDSLLLLGAGGAAAGAVLFLISRWKDLKSQMEEAVKLAERYHETLRAIEDVQESAREQIVRELGRTRPNATDDEVRKMIDRAVNLVENVGVELDRAVKIVTGQAPPLAPQEEDFLRRQRGFGARVGDAREQLTTFQSVSGRMDSINAIDTGKVGALMEFIKQAFGEEGGNAQQRIQAAQSILASRTGKRRLIHGIDENSLPLGHELLNALGIDPDEFGRAAGKTGGGGGLLSRILRGETEADRKVKSLRDEFHELIESILKRIGDLAAPGRPLVSGVGDDRISGLIDRAERVTERMERAASHTERANDVAIRTNARRGYSPQAVDATT